MSALRPAKSESLTSSTESIIDRSAAASAKGPRLQRLRVALFLLEAVEDDDNIQVYAAVEALGDAFITTSTATKSDAYSEENKNYDHQGTFTFVSKPVLNSIVLFLDQWITWHFSSTLRFGLYATVAIGKEKISGRIKDLNINLPDRAVIELLRDQNYSYPELLPCVVKLLLTEYEEQYKSSTATGHLQALRQWSEPTWIEFLKKIKWLFSEGDEAAAEKKVLDAVTRCRFYNDLHEGKEKIILSALLDLFDARQLASDFGNRFVHKSDVELLFRKVASGEIRSVDPTWQTWSQIPSPTDQRNVGEKLISACPTLSSRELSQYQRGTAAGLFELDAHGQDKNVIAMRYQIFDVCDQALSALIARAPALTPVQLELELDNLTNIALERVEERAKDYMYPYKTKTFVRGLVLELFDSCFLAFDEGPS